MGVFTLEPTGGGSGEQRVFVLEGNDSSSSNNFIPLGTLEHADAMKSSFLLCFSIIIVNSEAY